MAYTINYINKQDLLWLLVMLPVSLQVLEAGEGGGGMSKRSAVSLLEFFEDKLPENKTYIYIYNKLNLSKN